MSLLTLKGKPSAYFERQAEKARVSRSPLIRTMKATGLTRAIVTRIKCEQRRLLEGIKFHDTMSAFSCTSSFIAQRFSLVSGITMSCDCRMVIPYNIASIVVALIPMHGGTLASSVTDSLQSSSWRGTKS